MSRYEQHNDKKFLPLLMIILAGILLLLGAWVYILNDEDASIERVSQSLDIPKEKKRSGFRSGINSEIKPDKNNISEDNDSSGLLNDIPKKPVLMELDTSDEGFKKAVTMVSTDLGDWFEVKDVIRKYIMLIHDVSQNKILFKHKNFLKMPKKNMVKEDEQGLYLTREGYQRYDHFADALVAIDVKKGVSLYLTFKPLFNKVYNIFSYPESYKLEDIFLKAAANVINAPIEEGRIGLIKHTLFYKFSEKKLEKLNDVEKQMLRMGPENTKKIQAKLRQLVEAFSLLNE
ncbi:MAG: DUF3014 domain-containing protein [Methylococcaceae bacterium]|nr:DUF3014 domain-containing protein [Methylococcaceae bacterium]